MTLTGVPIGLDVIRKLMKPKKSDDVLKSNSYKERWPNEGDLVKLAKAVDRDSEYVLFKNGKRFKITYLDNGGVVIKPADWYRFVPMGFFSRRTLIDAKNNNIDPDDLSK